MDSRVVRSIIRGLFQLEDIEINASVLAFTFGISIVAGVLDSGVAGPHGAQGSGLVTVAQVGPGAAEKADGGLRLASKSVARAFWWFPNWHFL